MVIALLADSAYQEWWGGPFPAGLYTLLLLGGLVCAIVMLVRWAWDEIDFRILSPRRGARARSAAQHVGDRE